MRKRSLAGFGDVAKVDNDNVNINENNNKNENIMDIIMQPKTQKIMIGIYFDPDVAAALRQVAGKRKGAQSQLVNEVMRRFFRDQGLL